jgi:hypothetical protein
MKQLYFAMPLKMFNSDSSEKDKANLTKYQSIVAKLREKYKDKYKITEDLDLITVNDPIDALAYSVMCVMGATSLDGIIVPINYKEYRDLKALEAEVKKENKPMYFFDEISEQILTIEELKIFKELKKATTTTSKVVTSTKYSISNGDADIEYEELNDKKVITVYHMGTVTKYEIK